MDVFSSLAHGFAIALEPKALLFCFFGVTLGTFVGVLPGIGALAAISICLPITFYLEPTTALIMLAGIFYGAQYGGSTTSILLNLPGDASSSVTCLDGHQMTRQGRAGVALFTSAIASFIGGICAILLMVFLAPPLAALALEFTSAEYFSLMILGLVAASTLSVSSPVKGLSMVVLGMILGLIGVDHYSGEFRFAFGLLGLADGLSIAPVAMGLFGVGAIFSSIGREYQVAVDTRSITWWSLLPTRDDFKRAFWPTLRGTTVGAFAGILPGIGPTISTFLAYGVEKRVARDPSRLGRGAIEGVAAPEACNNACVQAAFIPTLSLGIPHDGIMAVLLGALMIHGITPGPQFIPQQPEIFWGLIASFWIGNVLLLVLNIPMIGVWVRILSIPYHILFPAILFFICIGAYGVNNNTFDVFVVLIFGIVGYFLARYEYPAAPVLLGFIIGPLLETHLRRELLLSRGDFRIFLERPVSAIALAVTALLVLLAILPLVRLGGKRLRQLGSRAQS
jgi:TctA family transporter